MHASRILLQDQCTSFTNPKYSWQVHIGAQIARFKEESVKIGPRKLLPVLPPILALAFLLRLTIVATEAADYVLHISIDGLRPSYMQTVIDGGFAPNLRRFQDEGAWTNNARTDYTHTITLPNHTSMITGRPVSLPAGMPAQTQHGYTDNIVPPTTTTIHNFTTPDWYKASTFDVVHDAGYATAMYASKTKFILYQQSYNQTPEVPTSNKISTFYSPEETSLMQSQMLSQLASEQFKYTFLHY